jgi:hypothetical protein
MNEQLKKHIINICNEKIVKKWWNVWVSFYAFFKNKNDSPEELMSVATWWIQENQLDHFEKAYKIIELIKKH